ncbi:MAG: sigma-E factor negative regulatory protein [Betaproteobacteria bacterium]|nr:sigma-E factor negative regulatory protein [Betaproteobacteria bacterium]
MVEQERVSALMDGELDGEDLGARLKKTAEDGDLAQCWDTYHLIGDVLRGENAFSTGFASKVSLALAQEPTILAPRPPASGRVARKPYVFALSAAATIAGVAVVGWLATLNPPGAPALAPSTVATVPSEGPIKASMTAQQMDADVSDYMMAHQEYSPTGAIHGAASYVRTVSTR